MEASGLRKGSEYSTQVSETTEDGRRYMPDAVVNLPDNKQIIIDSKVSLVAYEQYSSSTDENERLQMRKAHLESVKTISKNYPTNLTKNFRESIHLIMFYSSCQLKELSDLPLKQMRIFFLDAFKKNIMLVSPSTPAHHPAYHLQNLAV